jgi:hypothetical protein
MAKLTGGKTQSAAESIALAGAERAKRAAPATPAISPADLAAFNAWRVAQAEQQARASIGVKEMTLHDVPQAGTVGFTLTGAMPDAPNDKGSYLNDNKKVIVGGVTYTLQVGLYPYAGKQSPAQLKALGVVVGEF